MYKILLIGILLLSGCASHYWAANYDGFVREKNFHIGLKLRGSVDEEDEIKHLNEKEDIYIRTYDSGCKFGYVVNRDDPDKIIKSWAVLENKEKCESRSRWLF